jgi:hypothetical protein
VGLVADDAPGQASDATPVSVSKPLYKEIVVYLYDPDTDTIYTDELGVQALYSFQTSEINL